MRQPAGIFTRVNGREVFQNGANKRWRCPVCAWWREWDVESCSACGTQRDGTLHSKSHRGQHPSVSRWRGSSR